MPNGGESDPTAVPDVGEYCRRVEEHLARVNAGHLVRVVGAAFELARGWAIEGIPLSLVRRGIDQKAERHRAGRSRRPLRLEFCEADVRAVYDDWRRAVGVGGGVAPSPPTGTGDEPGVPEPRRPSLARHLDRAIERLVQAAGRLETPEALRDALGSILHAVVALRDEARGARGPAREAALARLATLDGQLVAAARAAVDPADLDRLSAEAAADLAPYRARLAPEAWQQSLELTVNRLLRAHLRLPTLEP
jgi:hypothetical protein